MFDLKKILSRAGYKLVLAKSNGKQRYIIVIDEENKNPELKPVLIGGKPVKKG